MIGSLEKALAESILSRIVLQRAFSGGVMESGPVARFCAFLRVGGRQGVYTRASAVQVTVVTTPWWMDPQYQIGMLSLNVRPIKLSNTLTYQEHFLEVPGEETMNEILER